MWGWLILEFTCLVVGMGCASKNNHACVVPCGPVSGFNINGYFTNAY